MGVKVRLVVGTEANADSRRDMQVRPERRVNEREREKESRSRNRKEESSGSV